MKIRKESNMFNLANQKKKILRLTRVKENNKQ
jgi:hypothetical protein